ncbi:MAG: 2'-5' RNA ligase family protein, partial [Chthoniobacterales bacterium]
MTPNWFVAWPVAAAADWIASLESGAPGGLHFLAPSDLHVTLAFLGRYEPVLLEKISSMLKQMPQEAIDITPKDFVALPQPRRFSALAFTLGKGLSEVEKQIARWRARICREAGAHLDTRVSLPHFTVARVEMGSGLATNACAPSGNLLFNFGQSLAKREG